MTLSRFKWTCCILTIFSIVLVTSDEFYVFYNHSNPGHWTQNEHYLRQYNQIIHRAVILTLYNITNYSVNISHSIAHWTPCMVFNIKLNTAPDGCPAIFNPQSSHAQYAAVFQYVLLTDGDLDAFTEYMNDILDSANYLFVLDKWLKTLDNTSTNTNAPIITSTAEYVTQTRSADVDTTTSEAITSSSSWNKDIYGNGVITKQIPIGLTILSIVFGVVLCVIMAFMFQCLVKKQNERNARHPHAVLRDIDLEEMDEIGEDDDETAPSLLTQRATHL